MKKTAFDTGWFFQRIGDLSRQQVVLPHDAMLHETRRADAPSGSGGAFFEGARYVYEKTFEKPQAAHVLIQFEGVYKNAKVYLNGKEAGGKAYGYVPFFVCADDYLTDGANTIRVECETGDQPDSRWYSGGGIYRPVWIWEGAADSIEPESVRISTVSYAPAVIRVQSPKPVRVEIEGICGGGTDFKMTIPDARLWSEDSPYLYTARVTNGMDSDEIRFGIRKVEWSNRGLFINGKETLLRGGCVHHDNGILGAATYDASEYRRVKKLRDMGYNAIRSSHNPCSRAMLEACDELGVYLMDESWDMWFKPKSRYDYAHYWRENHMADLKAMVDRDFNHPSVIFYSIGNEVSEPAMDEGLRVAEEMVDFLHREDPDRAVTGGINLMIIASKKKGKSVYKDEGGRDESSEQKLQGMSSVVFNIITNVVGSSMNKAANSKAADLASAPVLDLLDLAGYNYASGRYPLEGKAHPNRVIFGSETFPHDLNKNWTMVKKYPYLVGDFMWTAWDYIGETGAGSWAYTDDGKGFSKPYPWLLADIGAFDILGDPNGEAFHAAAIWDKLQAPVICVQPINHESRPAKSAWRGTNAIPCWSWRGCEGRKAVVEVYYPNGTVELQLNGKKIGKKKMTDGKAVFRVKYAPGTLSAHILDPRGIEIAAASVHSAETAQIRVCPEKECVSPREIVYVPILIGDEHGTAEANADSRLTVTVKGGELLGFGSANPRTTESFTDGTYTTYYGRALAVLRAGSSSEIIIYVNSRSDSCVKTLQIKE